MFIEWRVSPEWNRYTSRFVHLNGMLQLPQRHSLKLWFIPIGSIFFSRLPIGAFGRLGALSGRGMANTQASKCKRDSECLVFSGSLLQNRQVFGRRDQEGACCTLPCTLSLLFYKLY